MEADIWGPRQPEPSLSLAAARLGFGPACMACCADGLIGWRDPGSLPICEDRKIRLAM